MAQRPLLFKGFDTETNNLGNIVVVATDTEYARVTTFTDFINFMWSKDYKKSIFWTWNLQFDAEGIIKLALKEFAHDGTWREAAKQIMRGKEYDDMGVMVGKSEGWFFPLPNMGSVRIYYIKSKKLEIVYTTIPNRCKKPRNYKFLFYDIAQFYGYRSLNSQAKEWLGEEKEDYADWVDRVKSVQKGDMSYADLMEFLDKHVSKVGLYCQRDAYLTVELAKIMQKAFIEVGIPFNNPLSQASIAGSYLRSKQNYPFPPEKLKTKLINKAHEMAEAAFRGGMFESLQRGLYDQPVYDYDINSAYPYEMSKLPHWGNGVFKAVEEVNDDNEYGWYLCEFDCPYIPFADNFNSYTLDLSYNKDMSEDFIKIVFRQEEDGNDDEIAIPVPDEITKKKVSNPRILYPEGLRRQVITKTEYDFMKRNNFKCKAEIGVEWYQTKNTKESPFAWIPEMYNKRQEIKSVDENDMRQYSIKITLNSTYGKTAQTRPVTGDLTNFFYASYITAGTRVRLAEIMHKYNKDVIYAATDGICLTREVPELELGSSLGTWECQEFSGGLFIGSGIRQMFFLKPNKKGETYATYARGLTNDKTYDLYSIAKNNKDSEYLYSIKTRPLHIGECISHTKILDLDDLNKFTPVTKRISVNTDQKHIWSKTYKNFGDLLENKTYAKPARVEMKEDGSYEIITSSEYYNTEEN